VEPNIDSGQIGKLVPNEYITYKIKKLIEEDRRCLMKINGDGKDYLNRIGKVSYIRHYVIPEKNNGKEYYVYCINSFI